MRRALHRASPAAGLALALAGCASPRLQTTWLEGADAPRVAPAPLRRAAALALPPPTLDPEGAARRLELSLEAFSRALRRTRGAPRRRARGWSREALRIWAEVLGEVERALTHPAGTFSSRLLVSARVILEAERDRLAVSGGEPPADVDRRLALAFTRIAARLRPRRPDPTEREAIPRFRWPVSPVILTSGFGYRRDPVHRDGRLGFHAGLDLAGGRGDVVRAASAGQVVSAGWNGGLGRSVTLQHAGGFSTVYGHLSRVLVRSGDWIDADAPVGLVGRTGRATGAHLHFELRRGGTPLDPFDYLGPGRASELSEASGPDPDRG